MIKATLICPWYWGEKGVECSRSGCCGEIKKTKSKGEAMFSSKASCICAWKFSNDMNRWAVMLTFKNSSKQEYFHKTYLWTASFWKIVLFVCGFRAFWTGRREKAGRGKTLHWYIGVFQLKSMEFGYINWTIDPHAITGRFSCDICRAIISCIYWWERLRQTVW